MDLLRAVPETVEVVGLEIQLNENIRSIAPELREKYHPKLALFEKELVRLLKAWPGHQIDATRLNHYYWDELYKNRTSRKTDSQ